MPTTTLSVRDLSVSIGGHWILSDVSLDLPAGQVTGLAGESGSGKSMTALAILGLLPRGASATGSITLAGRDLPPFGAASLLTCGDGKSPWSSRTRRPPFIRC
jgi:ABC-type glutathione transport system ATPase component